MGDEGKRREAREVRDEGVRTSPLSFFKASSASRVSENDTNANPLDLPVSLSMMIFASITVPKRPKASFKSSSVV